MEFSLELLSTVFSKIKQGVGRLDENADYCFSTTFRIVLSVCKYQMIVEDDVNMKEYRIFALVDRAQNIGGYTQTD